MPPCTEKRPKEKRPPEIFPPEKRPTEKRPNILEKRPPLILGGRKKAPRGGKKVPTIFVGGGKNPAKRKKDPHAFSAIGKKPPYNNFPVTFHIFPAACHISLDLILFMILSIFSLMLPYIVVPHLIPSIPIFLLHLKLQANDLFLCQLTSFTITLLSDVNSLFIFLRHFSIFHYIFIVFQPLSLFNS